MNKKDQYAVYEKKPAHGSEVNEIILGPFNSEEEAITNSNRYGYNTNNYYVDKVNQDGNYKIPIYENGLQTEWTVDGIIGDDKYFRLLELGNGKDLPDMINITTK